MIKLGLIGYGYWGPNIARVVNGTGHTKLTAIADTNPSVLKHAKELYPWINTYEHIDDLLKSDTDCVVIATPVNTHFQLAQKALGAGKHVLVEKPLTNRLTQAQSLVRLAKNKRLTLMVGHTFEYNPSVIYVKNLIKKDALGQIYYMYSTRVNLGQIRGDINALWNLAPHDFSIFNFILNKKAIAISAFGSSFLQKGIEDVTFVLIKYPGNVLARIHVSWIDPSKIRQFTVVGSKKMLVCDDLDSEMPVKIFDKGVNTGDIAKGVSGEFKMKLRSGDVYAPRINTDEPLRMELEDFATSIRTGKIPRANGGNGLVVVKMLEAAQKSISQNGKWINL